MDIDFVILWVDGNDPAWQSEKNRYQDKEENENKTENNVTTTTESDKENEKDEEEDIMDGITLNYQSSIRIEKKGNNTDKTYHKKSYNWVGYNVNINGVKYYVVGDSDVTDELKRVNCDVIFIPVGGTYTMTDSEASSVVNKMKPKYAVPVHYDEVGSSANADDFVDGLNEKVKGIILK